MNNPLVFKAAIFSPEGECIMIVLGSKVQLDANGQYGRTVKLLAGTPWEDELSSSNIPPLSEWPDAEAS